MAVICYRLSVKPKVLDPSYNWMVIEHSARRRTRFCMPHIASGKSEEQVWKTKLPTKTLTEGAYNLPMYITLQRKTHNHLAPGVQPEDPVRQSSGTRRA